MEKPPLILIALYYLKSKEGEIPLSYPTLTFFIPNILLQVKVQKQPTKVANLPLWLETILFDCPAAIKRNDGTVKITTFFTG